MNLKTNFRTFANRAVLAFSSAWSFLIFFILIFSWVIIGFINGFSEFWKLLLDFFLTIITFLIVLLVQHTQIKENRSIQLKLDELLKVIEGARIELVKLEDQPDSKLDQIQSEFKELSKTKSN